MDLWNKLKASTKPIVLYGMGNGADKIINIMESKGIKISGVFASDGFVRKKLFHGMPIMSYDEAKAHFGDMVVLVSFGSSLKDVIDNIIRISSQQELYVPDVPVAGEGLFDIDFARKHKAQLERLYSLLAGDRDRLAYKTLIEYKLSGNISALLDNASDKYALYKLIAPVEKGIYMDCGAFNGDTVADYLKYVGTYQKIYAIEPDGRSFKKLVANLQGMDNVVPINAPLSFEESVGYFSTQGNRGSHLDEKGEPVRLRSIDGILQGEAVDYIKIDVEGEEAAVIKGAAATIQKYHPRLLVSCYHRAEDVFALPLQVLELYKDYKMHFHYPLYLPPWDASFIFV